MFYSRRELGFLIPALAAAQSTAPKPVQPSKAFRFEDLPIRESGPTRIGQILTGTTHTGFLIDLHETELAVGQAPHAPHRHVHEELLLVREGTVEVSIAGRATRLGAGSGAYIASNEEHGYRNVGTTPARYFVMAFGTD